MSLTFTALSSESKLMDSKKEIASFRVGDTISAGYKIAEGVSERVAFFKGVCVKKRNKGLMSYCILRKISRGVGVEKKILLHSPLLVSLSVERRGKVRRAVLNYLRNKLGTIKIKERFCSFAKKKPKNKESIKDISTKKNTTN